MNCKPGDLAKLVKAYHEENVGRYVEVHAYLGCIDGKHTWRASSCANALRCVPCETYEMHFAVPDEWMQPIRPGHPEYARVATMKKNGKKFR